MKLKAKMLADDGCCAVMSLSAWNGRGWELWGAVHAGLFDPDEFPQLKMMAPGESIVFDVTLSVGMEDAPVLVAAEGGAR